MMRASALLPGLAAPAGVVLFVASIAGASLALVAAGDGNGWLPHGARPPNWAFLSWAALFVAGWTLMIGAMMVPSALPFLLAAQRVGGVGASMVAGLAFTAVWVAVGGLLCAALWAVGGLLAELGPGRAEQLAGASMVLAAAYLASPLASTCQRACARPFAILAQHWHGSDQRHRDALAAGLRYGVSCVGCCVPMIALMLVVGMHDLTWILGLSVLMALQKHSAWGAHMALPAAAMLALAGLAVAIGWWALPLYSIRSLCGA